MFCQTSASASNSTKPQYPSTRETRILKLQSRTRVVLIACLFIGAWNLFGVWNLGFGASHSTNESPVRNERPVNKQSAPDQISLRHRPPPAAVKTVVAVVAHRKIAVLRHGKRFHRIGHDQMTGTVAPVSVFRLHHSLKAKTFRDFSIDIQPGRLDSQGIAR